MISNKKELETKVANENYRLVRTEPNTNERSYKNPYRLNINNISLHKPLSKL